MDYTKDIEIDETALDVEWLNQPGLAKRYGFAVADLQEEVSLKEEELKVRRSELIMEVNEDPDGTVCKSKPNAGDIEAYYRSDENYKNLKEELISLRKELQYATVAYDQINYARKASLENLVKLHGQSYFAGPAVPRDIKREANVAREKQVRTSNKKVKIKREK